MFSGGWPPEQPRNFTFFFQPMEPRFFVRGGHGCAPAREAYIVVTRGLSGPLGLLAIRLCRASQPNGINSMASNRGIVYIGPGKVEVQGIDYPKFVAPNGKEIDHGVIVRIVSTNICGSDQHMVRGRTTAPPGLVLGHEITGEVIEKGPDVEFLEIGDLVSLPFNVACGRCRTCRAGDTGVCLTVNPGLPGGAYGYVD